MPTNVPAMRGSFGTTEYFLLTMRAGELTGKLTVPKEMEGWDDLSPEERFQRDVNYKRVKEQIAPYLANDPDRFIGAFIVYSAIVSFSRECAHKYSTVFR